MKRHSRYRTAVRSAARGAATEADVVAELTANGFNLAHLFGIADDRGWSLAISVRKGRITLHAFAGPPPARSDKRGWLLPPYGGQLACSPVSRDLDFDTAAAELYAMALEEGTA